MRLEPALSTLDEVEELSRLGRALQKGLAALLAYPSESRLAIGVDDELREPLLLDECQCMHDGEELPDVIRSLREGPHLEDDPTRR